MRRQNLNAPNNTCKCLINYQDNQVIIKQDEECKLEDNTLRNKWKITNKNYATVTIPSVCLVLTTSDEDAIEMAQL